MKRNMVWAVFVLAAIAVALATNVASAEERAFKAQLTPSGANGSITYLDGTATHLGICTAEANDVYSEDRTSVDGSMLLTGHSGDSLTIVYTQVFDGTQWVGTYAISDGTGRFEGASGMGDFTVIVNNARPPTWSFEGTISF